MKRANDFLNEYLNYVGYEADDLYRLELSEFDYIGDGKFKNKYEDEVFSIEDFYSIFNSWTHTHIDEPLREFVLSYLKTKLIEGYNLINNWINLEF